MHKETERRRLFHHICPCFHAKHIEIAFSICYTGKALGVLAQLGERYAGSVEVRGSNPLSSTS